MRTRKMKLAFWWLMVCIIGLAIATVWGTYVYLSKEFNYWDWSNSEITRWYNPILTWSRDLIYWCLIPTIVLFTLLFLVLNEISKLNQRIKVVTIKTIKTIKREI